MPPKDKAVPCSPFRRVCRPTNHGQPVLGEQEQCRLFNGKSLNTVVGLHFTKVGFQPVKVNTYFQVLGLVISSISSINLSFFVPVQIPLWKPHLCCPRWDDPDQIPVSRVTPRPVLCPPRNHGEVAP